MKYCRPFMFMIETFCTFWYNIKIPSFSSCQPSRKMCKEIVPTHECAPLLFLIKQLLLQYINCFYCLQRSLDKTQNLYHSFNTCNVCQLLPQEHAPWLHFLRNSWHIFRNSSAFWVLISMLKHEKKTRVTLSCCCDHVGERWLYSRSIPEWHCLLSCP